MKPSELTMLSSIAAAAPSWPCLARMALCTSLPRRLAAISDEMVCGGDCGVIEACAAPAPSSRPTRNQMLLILHSP